MFRGRRDTIFVLQELQAGKKLANRYHRVTVEYSDIITHGITNGKNWNVARASDKRFEPRRQNTTTPAYRYFVLFMLTVCGRRLLLCGGG